MFQPGVHTFLLEDMLGTVDRQSRSDSTCKERGEQDGIPELESSYQPGGAGLRDLLSSWAADHRKTQFLKAA